MTEPIFNYLVQFERDMRTSIENQLRSSRDISSTRRMWLGSLYLQLRILIMQKAVRSGLYVPLDGMAAILMLAISKGDVIFDIGANVGSVTQDAALLVGRRGSVHSFEPSPTTMRYLQHRLVCLGLSNVILNVFALGAVSGTAILYEYSENFGGSSSLRPGAAPGQHLSVKTQVAVKVLDDYVEKNSIAQVRLIKMDVQGSEIDVLHGASRLLTAPNRPALFVEIEQVANAAFGYGVNDLINELTRLDYNLYSWRKMGLVCVKSEKDIPMNGHDDVICLVPGIHDALFNQLERLSRQTKSRLTKVTD
jgi:FkbM family methyltransferase